VIASALLLGGITNAGLNVQSASFPQSLTGVIEGIILFCVLGSEVFTRYRVRSVTKAPVTDEPMAQEPVAA
jgi:general nucleoside transport system permease protein